MFLEDAGNLIGVRDITITLCLAYPTNQAADHLSRGLANCLAIEQFVDRRSQIFTVGLGLCITATGLKTVLIVDAAGIADSTLFIEHEDLRIARGAERIGQRIVQILEQREVHTVDFGVLRHFRDGVLSIRVDANERHALRFVSLGQLRQSRSVKFAQWAFHTQEGHDHQLRVFQLGKRMGFSAKVLQREIVYPLTNLRCELVLGQSTSC